MSIHVNLRGSHKTRDLQLESFTAEQPMNSFSQSSSEAGLHTELVRGVNSAKQTGEHSCKSSWFTEDRGLTTGVFHCRAADEQFLTVYDSVFHNVFLLCKIYHSYLLHTITVL